METGSGGPVVDEVFRNRRNDGASRCLDSPVRAAGGFPTQGGGVLADRAAAGVGPSLAGAR
jgi:hypothetical protein